MTISPTSDRVDFRAVHALGRNRLSIPEWRKACERLPEWPLRGNDDFIALVALLVTREVVALDVNHKPTLCYVIRTSALDH